VEKVYLSGRSELWTVELSCAKWLQWSARIWICGRSTLPGQDSHTSCKSSFALSHSRVHRRSRNYVACANTVAGTDAPSRGGRNINAGGRLVVTAHGGELGARIRDSRTDGDRLKRTIVTAA